MNSDSPKNTLNTTDWKKIGIGGLIAVSGAVLTYVSTTVTQIDFGVYTPIVVAFWSVIANLIRKFVADHSE